jgi:hypothetical protein
MATLVLILVLSTLVPPAMAGDNNQTDNTYCQGRFNLGPENRINISVPTVVDINPANGNLLVRGQIPLVVRDGPGNTAGCRVHADWHYAYDGLDALMKDKKTFIPAYFNAQNNNAEKGVALQKAMAGFTLDDYEVIDISLLNSNSPNIDMQEFDTIKGAFGGAYSVCNATPADATFFGRNGHAILSDFYFCREGENAETCRKSIVMDLPNGEAGKTCSYAARIDQIAGLMEGNAKDPAKKRLIYYHCSQGSDRTGSVTMGYLQKTIPGLSYVHALHYAQFLGKETQGSDAMWPVGYGADTAALAYCRYIGADCTQTEETRVLLPGRETHSHLPGQEDAPAVTATPVPTPPPVPAQTPVPTERYHPDRGGDAIF